MTITVIHIHRFEFPCGFAPWATPRNLKDLEDRIVSALSDKIAEVNTRIDAAIARVQGDVATLKQQIADLQAKVDAGGATPADMDALQALEDKLDSLDPATPSTI